MKPKSILDTLDIETHDGAGLASSWRTLNQADIGHFWISQTSSADTDDTSLLIGIQFGQFYKCDPI